MSLVIPNLWIFLLYMYVCIKFNSLTDIENTWNYMSLDIPLINHPFLLFLRDMGISKNIFFKRQYCAFYWYNSARSVSWPTVWWCLVGCWCLVATTTQRIWCLPNRLWSPAELATRMTRFLSTPQTCWPARAASSKFHTDSIASLSPGSLPANQRKWRTRRSRLWAPIEFGWILRISPASSV